MTLIARDLIEPYLIAHDLIERRRRSRDAAYAAYAAYAASPGNAYTGRTDNLRNRWPQASTTLSKCFLLVSSVRGL